MEQLIALIDDFDIRTTSALDTADLLVRAAYEDPQLDTGLDMPASSGVWRARTGMGVMHVEFPALPVPPAGQLPLSDPPSIVPPIHRSPPGPSTTRNPFKHSVQSNSFVGSFGGTLRDYGELVAIFTALDLDTRVLRDWFVHTWGVQDLVALGASVPVCASGPETLWGGIGRNLNPSCFLDMSAQSGVIVVQHGITRHDFGPGALVDWARVDAIVRMLAVQHLIDDRVDLRGRVDFTLAPHELMRTPRRVSLAVLPLQHVDTRVEANKVFLLSRMGLKALAASSARHRSMEYIHHGEHCTVALRDQRMLDHALYVGSQALPPLPEGPLTQPAAVNPRNDMVEASIETAPRSVRLAVHAELGDDRNVRVRWQDGFEAVVRDVVRSRGAPAARRLEEARVEHADEAPDNFALRMALLREYLPASAMRSFVGLGNVVAPGMGRRWVGKMYFQAGLPPGDLTIQNLDALWSRMLTRCELVKLMWPRFDTVCWQDLADISWRVTSSAARIGWQAHDFGAFMNAAVRQRKAYWVRRYVRACTAEFRAAGDNDVLYRKAVLHQLLAAVFRKLHVHVDEEGVAEVAGEGQLIANVFAASAEKRVRKQKRLEPTDKLHNPPVATFENVRSGGLDLWLESRLTGEQPVRVPYREILPDVLRRVTKFNADVRDFVAELLVTPGNLDADWVPEHEIADMDFEPRVAQFGHGAPVTVTQLPPANWIELWAQGLGRWRGVTAEPLLAQGRYLADVVVAPPPLPLELSAADFDGVADGALHAAAGSSRVNVVAELHDDWPGISPAIVDDVVRQIGSVASLGAYTDALTEARRNYYRERDRAALGENLGPGVVDDVGPAFGGARAHERA